MVLYKVKIQQIWVDQLRNRETIEMANSTENITESSDRGMDSTVIGLEMSSSDWFITCHQFISGLLFEPDLCQFFAKQSSIDLKSNKIDDKLSPYTRSIMNTH